MTIFEKYGRIIDVRDSGQQDIDKEIRKTTINQHKQGVKNQNSENWEKSNEEFDPGSGWTLTECLTHASRLESLDLGGGRVSNA